MTAVRLSVTHARLGKKWNDTANGALRDAEVRLYHGVL
jgi:hypothetical protein